MKTFTLLCAFLLCCWLSLSFSLSVKGQDTIQKDTTVADSMSGVDQYVFYDSEAAFPGDENALKKYISKNLVKPREVVEEGVVGTAVVSFVVRSNGKITNIEVVKSSNCAPCDQEAIHLIKGMPDWRPAVAYDKFVDTTVEIPIRFRK